MKKKLFTVLSLAALMGIGCLTSCGSKSVESVSIDPVDCQQVKVGGTVQFTATVLPNDATNKNVTWSVDNTSVGTVDQNGLFTALTEGDATVTVTTVDGKKTATCDVVVDPAPKTIDSVVIDPRGTKTVKVGDEITFTATVTGTSSIRNVIWSSSDSSVGEISTQGKFNAKAVGTTTVTCKSFFDQTKSDTCVVTVESAEPAYYFSYSTETVANPIKLVKTQGKDKEYTLPSPVNLKAEHLLEFTESGVPFAVYAKPDEGEKHNNVRIDSAGLFPHNDANNVNIYLDTTNPNSFYVWVDGYVEEPPVTHTFTVSVGETSYNLVEDSQKKYTYNLSEKISVSADQDIKFFDNGTQIAANIIEAPDDSAKKIYNNSEGSKVLWDATNVNIVFNDNNNSYTFWVDGGHSFTKDGYYLLGSSTGWNHKKAQVTGTESGDVLTFKRILSSGDEFKVAYIKDGTIGEAGWFNPNPSQSVLCEGCSITQDGNIKVGSGGQYIIKFTKTAIVSPQEEETHKYEVTKDTSALTLAYKLNAGSYADFPAPKEVTESEIAYYEYSSSITFKKDDVINLYVKQGEGEYIPLVTPLDFYRPYKEFTVEQGKEGMVCTTAGTYTIQVLNPKSSEKGIFKIAEGTFNTGYYLASNIFGWNILNVDGFFFGEIQPGSDNITVPQQALNGSSKENCSYKFVHIDSTGKKDWNEFDTTVADNAIDGVNIALDGETKNAKVLVDTVFVNFIIKEKTAALTKANPEVKYVDKQNVEHDCTRGEDGKYAVTPEAGSAFAKDDTIRIKVAGNLETSLSIGGTETFSSAGGVVTCLVAGTYQVVYDMAKCELIITNKGLASDYYIKDGQGNVYNLTKHEGPGEVQYDSSVLTFTQAQIIKIYDNHDAPMSDFVLSNDTASIFLNSSGDSISLKGDCQLTLYIQPIAKKIYADTEMESGFYMIAGESGWVPYAEAKVADLPVSPAIQSEYSESFTCGAKFKFVKVEGKLVSYQTFKFENQPDPSILIIDEYGNIEVTAIDGCTLNFYLKTNGETWVTVKTK